MFNLNQISSETRFRAPRIILLGVEKIGKSTFASESDNPVFLPIGGEEGIDSLGVNATPACSNYNDVIGWLCSLGKDSHNYKTVVIDSASALEPLIHAEACKNLGDSDNISKAGGGWGAGYNESLRLWRGVTDVLDALRDEKDTTSILIGHVKVRRFDDPAGESYDQYVFDVQEKAHNLLYRWADCILFMNTKVLVKKEDVGFGKQKARGLEITPGSRYLYTQKRPAHPGGGRGVYGQLPYELLLPRNKSWNVFKDAVVNAIANATGKTT